MVGLIYRILDFFLPRICPICGGRLSLSEEQLCLSCLLKLPRTAYDTNTKRNEVKYFFELKIPIVRAASYMRYMPNSDSANVIKAIKYHKGKGLAKMMGRMMAEEFSVAKPNFFDGVDMIIPMPLTRKRYRKRGYNQAEELCKGIAEVTNLEINTTAVKRKYFKISQTQLARYERYANVTNAFECVSPKRLNGKHILLVDDVVTTGATLLSLADSIVDQTEGVNFSVLTLGVTGELKHIR